ncbi:hypothetical protein CRG98_035969, partial [Punica granatum]
THFILPEYLMQKDQRLDIDEAKDKMKQAGITEDEMVALERQLAPAVANDTVTTKEARTAVGFVSGGVESQTDRAAKMSANNEDIELPEDSESEDEEEERVKIAQKDVPSAVFGGLIRKREEDEKDEKDERGDDAAKDKDGESRLGALERIKRQKRGA